MSLLVGNDGGAYLQRAATNADFTNNVNYEEYTGGSVAVTSDGGHTWTAINPCVTSAQVSTPLKLDPTDSNHLIIGGARHR